jgi:uncharacterized protein (DUF885 family)
MEDILKQILEKLVHLEQGQQELKVDITKIDNNLEKLTLFTQQDVAALLELVDKKIDRQEGKFDVLNSRLFNQEAEIQGLKRAK